MTRALSVSMQNAVAAGIIRPVYLFWAEFTGVSLRLNSSLEDVSWGGQTWLGNGVFLGFDSITETTEQDANNLVVHITGSDTTLVSLVLSATNQTRYGQLFLALRDADRNLVIDPVELFFGYFNNATITENGGECIIDLDYENELIAQKNMQEFRYSDFSQKALYPNDKGFEFASAAEDWNGFWGKAEKPKKVSNNSKKRKNNR